MTEIVDAAFERGYTLAFRQRAGGWEAAWRPARSEGAAAPPAFAATRTEAAELALAAIRHAAAA